VGWGFVVVDGVLWRVVGGVFWLQMGFGAYWKYVIYVVILMLEGV